VRPITGIFLTIPKTGAGGDLSAVAILEFKRWGHSVAKDKVGRPT